MSLSYAAEQVRAQDIDRFHLAMVAPAEVQEPWLALDAFNLEISRTASRVTDPNLGLIRLQWWREVLDEIESGKPVRAHQVALELQKIGERLDVVSLSNLIEAHANDLEEGALETVEDLRVHLVKTSGALLVAQARLLQAEGVEGIANHLGCAFGFVGLGRALVCARADHLRVPRTWTNDLELSVLEAAGQAAMHLDRAEELWTEKSKPRALKPLFALRSLIRPWVRRLQGFQDTAAAARPSFARPLPFQALRLAFARR